MAGKVGFFQGLVHADINPVNHKSRTLPLLNIMDKYSRAFHLSWLGFFVAFLSWFAFPTLIHGIIQKDLQLTHTQIATSNIVGLLATFFVRFIAGPLCDRYGPRYVMVGCLLGGAIPTAMTPLITNASHLIAVRFFVGVLGGTFVPCQFWTNQFFDKNIIGSANALAAGWGNAGGGVTFFVMPAVVSSLMNHHGIGQYWAWRLAFLICPLVIILSVAVASLVFGEDTPTGSWSARISQQKTRVVDREKVDISQSKVNGEELKTTSPGYSQLKQEEISPPSEVQIPLMDGLAENSRDSNGIRAVTVDNESPRAPTAMDICRTTFSSQTFLVALPYLCSFGSELAVEGVISDFYIQTAKIQDGMLWNSQAAGIWAAVFGLLNIFTRPLGGYFSDLLYRRQGITAKKWWIIFLGLAQGICFIVIGYCNFKIYPLIGAMTVLAVFMEAANGAIFSLVPSIHPRFNGVVSGVTGAAGNAGGVIFCLVFLFYGANYRTTLSIIGVCCLCLNLAVTWIKV